MSVINPDEWRPVAVVAAGTEWAADYHEKDIRAAAAVLCLLDLARYGTVQWFPDTDPVDVPWARFARNTPEWVRCVNPDERRLTAGKVYRVERRDEAFIFIRGDDELLRCYFPERFVPASADEATVTIDVPVAWARWRVGFSGGDFDSEVVNDACREALTKAGLL